MRFSAKQKPDADRLVAEIRQSIPDLTEAEERSIRAAVINGTGLFLRCTFAQAEGCSSGIIMGEWPELVIGENL